MINYNKIFYTKPSISDLEISYVNDAICNGWGENCYDYIVKFENEFSKFINIKHTIATSSGTGALHLGLAALGIGKGDEVILADTNWIASVAPVVHLGAKPIFVDIRPDTWCIDPQKVLSAITKKTRAIIAVHLYGNLCDMSILESIAHDHDLLLIEDAAEAIGSRWGNTYAGSRGIFGIFSFHGTKTMTTGEGGALITNNDELAKKVRELNNHGRKLNDEKQFWAANIGYKFKMSNLEAAMGCAQLKRIDSLIAKRREIFFKYHKSLSRFNSIKMNPIPTNGDIYNYWMPTIVLPRDSKINASLLLKKFKEYNIDGRSFFYPLSMQANFIHNPHNTVSWNIYKRAINLPSYHDMTDSEIAFVCSIIGQSI